MQVCLNANVPKK